jgi:hypothetical protein
MPASRRLPPRRGAGGTPRSSLRAPAPAENARGFPAYVAGPTLTACTARRRRSPMLCGIYIHGSSTKSKDRRGSAPGKSALKCRRMEGGAIARFWFRNIISVPGEQRISAKNYASISTAYPTSSDDCPEQERLRHGDSDGVSAPGLRPAALLARLRTQKIAEPVAAARDQRPQARACGAWPPIHPARKNRQSCRQPPGPCGRE